MADWSRRRARGEKVTREPPSLERPQILMAEEQKAPQKLEATIAAVPTPAPAAQQAAAAAAEASEIEGTAQSETIAAGAQAAQPEGEGKSLRRRLLGMFGG